MDYKTKTVKCANCSELMFRSNEKSKKGYNHFYCECGYTFDYKFIMKL